MTTKENNQQIIARSRGGLYDTIWPLELADSWRSQVAPMGGFEAGFDKTAIQRAAINLDQPFTGYTRDKNQVFILGGAPYLMNSYTEMYMTHTTYPEDASAADLLSNREHIPYLAKIDPVTLTYQTVQLTEGRNRALNYPGGALMHSNGFVYAAAQAVLYKIDPATMEILKTTLLPLVEGKPEVTISTIYNGLQALANGRIVTKCFTSTDIGQGWVLQIDPDSLDIIVAKLIEVQSARLMIDEPEPGVAYAYMPTLTESRRFLITDDDFVLDEAWSAIYRDKNNSSTTWANGTLFAMEHVVFPDNSAPGESISQPLHFFLHPAHNPPKVLQPHNAVGDQPGINFWKIGGNSYDSAGHGIIITFVPTNEKIAAYRLFENGNIEKLWEKNYFASASPAMVASTDLLYTNDYRNGHDNFVVVRLSTGEELAYVEIPDATETTMGIIFPGMNNDVYLCSTQTGEPVNSGIFNRFYLPS